MCPKDADRMVNSVDPDQTANILPLRNYGMDFVFLEITGKSWADAPDQSELPRPIKIRPRMYVRCSIMYEKAAFYSSEEYNSVAR